MLELRVISSDLYHNCFIIFLILILHISHYSSYKTFNYTIQPSISKRHISSANFMMHEIHCRRHIVLCEHCDEPIPQTELEQHFNELHAKVPCDKCQEKISKDCMEKHMVGRSCFTIKIVCSLNVVVFCNVNLKVSCLCFLAYDIQLSYEMCNYVWFYLGFMLESCCDCKAIYR